MIVRMAWVTEHMTDNWLRVSPEEPGRAPGYELCGSWFRALITFPPKKLPFKPPQKAIVYPSNLPQKQRFSLIKPPVCTLFIPYVSLIPLYFLLPRLFISSL